jgi:glyoxylase-like metal-dependent hydrolase (beta-lactamase superfamily II)
MEGRRGYWWDLLPPDFERRVRWIEEIPQGDLFGDGSVRAIPLPGHSPGMHGLLSEQLIYAADAAGHSRILEGKARRRLSTLIAWDRGQEAQSVALLRQYPSHLPRILAHCPLPQGPFERSPC